MSFISQNTTTKYPVKLNRSTVNFDDLKLQMKNLKIIGISSISDDGKMTLYSNEDFFETEGIENYHLLLCLSEQIKRSIPLLLNDLYTMNKNIDPSFFEMSFLIGTFKMHHWEVAETVEELIPDLNNDYLMHKREFSLMVREIDSNAKKCTLPYTEYDKDGNKVYCFREVSEAEAREYYEKRAENYFNEKVLPVKERLMKLKKLPMDTPSEKWMTNLMIPNVTKCPAIIDGHGGYDNHIEILPFIINEWNTTEDPKIVKILANIIKKEFIGIGGFIEHKGTKSVYFMREDHKCNDESDYRHCVSFEINPKKLEEFYYHPLTVGEYLSKKYAEIWEMDETQNYGYLSRVLCDIMKFVPEKLALIYDQHREDMLTGYDNEATIGGIWGERRAIRAQEKEICNSEEPFPLYSSKIGSIARLEMELRDLESVGKILNNYSLEEKKKAYGEYRSKFIHKKDPLVDALVANRWKPNFDEEKYKKTRESLEKLKSENKDYHLEHIDIGFYYFQDVPIDLQILACAEVANLSREEMTKRLNEASHKNYLY